VFSLRQAQGPPFDPAVPEPVEGEGLSEDKKNRMKKIPPKKLKLHILGARGDFCPSFNWEALYNKYMIKISRKMGTKIFTGMKR
jgi:hypothetical protein